MDFKVEEGLLEGYETSWWDIYKYLFTPHGGPISQKNGFHPSIAERSNEFVEVTWRNLSEGLIYRGHCD